MGRWVSQNQEDKIISLRTYTYLIRKSMIPPFCTTLVQITFKVRIYRALNVFSQVTSRHDCAILLLTLSPKKIEEGKFTKESDKLGQERRKTTVEDRLENLL